MDNYTDNLFGQLNKQSLGPGWKYMTHRFCFGTNCWSKKKYIEVQSKAVHIHGVKILNKYLTVYRMIYNEMATFILMVYLHN